MVSSRFAPHLEKCMGLKGGRTSGRVQRAASARVGSLAEDDDEDDDILLYGNEDVRVAPSESKRRCGVCFCSLLVC